jgi:hypothetical protein
MSFRDIVIEKFAEEIFKLEDIICHKCGHSNDEYSKGGIYPDWFFENMFSWKIKGE